MKKKQSSLKIFITSMMVISMLLLGCTTSLKRTCGAVMPELGMGISHQMILERPGKPDVPVRCMSEKELSDTLIYLKQLEYCLGTDE